MPPCNPKRIPSRTEVSTGLAQLSSTLLSARPGCKSAIACRGIASLLKSGSPSNGMFLVGQVGSIRFAGGGAVPFRERELGP